MEKKPVTINLITNIDDEIRKFQEELTNYTHMKWKYTDVVNLLIEEGIKHLKFKNTPNHNN